MSISDMNRELGLRINKEIWNDQRFEKIPDYFTEDFIADYSPRIVREGRDQIEKMVRASHETFEGFREDVRLCIADEDHIVVHFTISGKQVKDWGPIPASNRSVNYDEIVIMKVRDGKVFHQIGISDALLALQQIGSIPDPAGFAKRSLQ